MINTTLEGGSLSPSAQRILFDLLVEAEDWDSLATMCRLTNLDDAIDVDLGKLSSVKVQAAWYSRPGRDVEQIRTGIRREKRVGVLVGLASGSFDDPEMYRAIAAGSRSAKVQLAIALNTGAPDDVRRDAVRVLACQGDSLNRAQTKELFDLMRRDRTLSASALETATGAGLLAECVLAEEATAAGKENLVAQLQVLASRELKTATSGFDRWECMRRVRDLAKVAAAAASADWFDADLAVALEGVLDVLEQAWEKTARGRTDNPVAEARLELAKRLEQARDDLSSLRARAAEGDEDEVLAVLAELEGMPTDRLVPVLEEVLANRRAGVRVQRKALSRLHFTSRQRIIDSHARYGTATIAAMVLEGMLRTPRGEVADLVIMHLSEVGEYTQSRVLRAVVSGHLTHEQMLALPAKGLAELCKLDVVGDEVRPLLGAALARELDGEPPTVWAQFRAMGPGYPGTVGQLLTVCRATAQA